MRKVISLTIFVTGAILLAAGSTASQASSVAGDWDASMNTPGGARPFKLVFKVDGEMLTGTAKRKDGEYPLTGKIKGSDIAFEYTVQFNGSDLLLRFTGKVNGDSMNGTVIFGNLVVDPNTESQAADSWSAKRPPAGKPTLAANSETIIFKNPAVGFDAELEGLPQYPPSPGKHPLVVFIHGSGKGTRFEYDNLFQLFLSNGFAVFSYDKRGVGKSGETYIGVGPKNSPMMIPLPASDA